MRCEHVQEQLELNGRTEAALSNDERAHLADCPVCQAYRFDVATMRQALRASNAVVPQHVRRFRAPRRYLPVSLAAAAGFAVLAITVGLLLGPLQQTEPELLLGWEREDIRLSFNSPADLQAVRFQLILPDNAEVEGHPGERSLEWTDDLAEGTNTLRIPLIVRGRADGQLLARLEHDGRSRELRVPLQPYFE